MGGSVKSLNKLTSKGDGDMAKFLFKAVYTREGAGGLSSEGGVRRREALAATVEAMGGSVEAFYYAFGETDLYIIADLPDDAAAAAIALTIGRAGVLEINTTVLIEPETVDMAVQKSVPYRVPGS